MEEIDITTLNNNFFEAVSTEYMLICAGTPKSYNMMTASWGAFGWLWNKPVALIFIRPERYSYNFTENHDYISLSFLGLQPEIRKLYHLCGTQSGREVNKMEIPGLTPVGICNDQCVSFQESRLILVGKKVYATNLNKQDFLDDTIYNRWYNKQQGNLHRLYILEILHTYTNK